MDDTARAMLIERAATDPAADAAPAPRPVRVWDLPTRVCHWTVVACVALGWATAKAEGPWFVAHQAAGYVLGTALLFRIVWGVAGSRHSRFADFVRPWPVVRAYLADLAALRPPRSVGHNPAGGWMVVALLATLAAVALTGLFAAGRGLHGPMAATLAPEAARLAAALHGGAFGLLIVLVAVHVGGVVVDAVLTGDRPLRAMWSGRKDLLPHEAAGEGRMVATRWAVATAAVAAVFVVCALA